MLCIRFSDDETVHALNREWRKKDSVTDVLSFPMQDGDEPEADESLGDIILATPFTTKEAARLSLPVTDHMLHLIVHATLHLLGYDHIDDEDAKIMHKHERAAMNKLGLHDPYPNDDEIEDEDEQDV
jgi:probable rRNA maturation factor